MRRWISILGWLAFLLCSIKDLPGYGKRWGLSEFGLPTTLLASDGLHYRDGSEIEPAMHVILRSGLEGPVVSLLSVVLLAALAWLRVEIRKWRQVSRDSQELREQQERWMSIGQRKLSPLDRAFHQGGL